MLSDLHLGHRAFDKKLFERHRALAKQARARVLFLGDALEAVVTGSKVANLGGMFDQTMAVGDQEDAFIETMKGFRVLAVIDGNHERRITRVTGTSPLKRVVKELERNQRHPCFHSQHGCFVNIKVGDQKYCIVIHHGEGGTTTFFKKLMGDFQGADAYFAGHTHELLSSEVFVHTAKGTKRVFYARTGAYIHLPAYAADKPSNYGIPVTGSWLLWLYPDKRRMRLERLEDRADR